ncbi:cytochrome c oxidase subunit 7C, mitochondrial [Solea senegalensis]|uniref:Cytochrome c oxidase subunit 7C, mitochondrial n=1 Tax=Solea senegalensis TaxID=28829 RepID=A0AAV6QJ31_SOLSE|nr:cytochrome c oxidase subunit 7C, mitochondrial [Solea senegalensis]
MLGQAVRRFATSAVRSSHYAEGPGNNLPFSVENKWRLLGMMTSDPKEVEWPSPVLLLPWSSAGAFIHPSSVSTGEWKSLICLCK